MGDANTRSFSYASLVAGGLLILMGALAWPLMMGAWSGMMGSTMMRGYMPGTMADWTGGALWWPTLVGIASGALVLYAATRLRADPPQTALVATLAIVGGATSLITMGGWIVGATLAIVGGALALADGKIGADDAAAR